MKRLLCVVLTLMIAVCALPLCVASADSDTVFLIADWVASDNSTLSFYDDGTFTFDWGFMMEDGDWAVEKKTDDTFYLDIDSNGLLSLMSLAYGVMDSEYHFEILKCNDDNIYLVQVLSGETAKTSRCKLGFTRDGAKSNFSYEDDVIPTQAEDELPGLRNVRIYNDSSSYGMNEPQEWPDGKKGGHYEDFKWGDALFTVPSFQLIDQSMKSQNSANYNLAMACGALCTTSYNHEYLKQAYNDLGFKDKNIFLYSYPDSSLNRNDAKRNGGNFADDKDLAFSIATREMENNGEEFDLLAITLRGTNNRHEAIKDGTCNPDKEYYGYIAWDWIYEFEEDVFTGLEDFYAEHSWLGERPMKILVTGYSLGGAGADLVAAKLNYEADTDRWFAKNTDKDDIYAYTFGAIDALSIEESRDNLRQTVVFPVKEGFENIINIYNLLDTFGPNSSGAYGLFQAAGNTMYGKYGGFLSFRNSMRGIVNPDSDWPTHEIVGYVHAVKSGWPAVDTGSMRRVWIRCPVDVEVYSDGDLLCKTEGGEVVTESSEIDVCIENEAKTILLPADMACRILITATDGGTMDYSVMDITSDDTAFIEYSDISLQKDKRILCELSPDITAQESKLFVVDQNENKTHQIAPDGKETALDAGVQGDGASSESVSTVKNSDSGDTAKASFLPWWVWLLIGVGSAVLIGAVAIAIFLKRRRKKIEAQRRRFLNNLNNQ
ncbi:MAG: hypothetical protein IJG87_02975 [Ruminococcus sp.]|nr:hypothetical protein [Ruminococcus sp.]